SGYFLANLSPADRGKTEEQAVLARAGWRDLMMRRASQLSEAENANLLRHELTLSQREAMSLYRFLGQTVEVGVSIPCMTTPRDRVNASLPPETAASGDGLLRFKRKAKPKGPLPVFGYDYFADHAKAARVATPRLLSYEGLWG